MLEHPIKKTHKSTFDLKNILASTLLSVLCMSILLPFFMPKQVQIDWSQIDNLVEYANISRESGKFKINIITKVNMENAEVYALVNDERVEVEKTNQGYSFTYIFDQDLHRLDDGYIICLAYKIEDIEIKDAVLKITDIRYNGYSWEKLYLKNNYQ